MKRSIIPAFLFFLCACLSAQDDALLLASDVWPPFTNEEGQTAFAIDLVSEALKRTDVTIRRDIVTFDKVLRGLEADVYDGCAAIWKSPERERFLIFSAPYLENRLILVGRKGADVSAASLADLVGKKVAIVSTYAYGEGTDALTGVELVEGSSDQENLDKLLAGEVDYMLVDELLIQYLAQYQSEDVSKNLEVGTSAMITRSLHFALRSDLPGAREVIDNFNYEIREMIADGTYNRVLQLNWIRADVDGDGRVELVLGGDRAGTVAPSTSYDVMTAGSAKTESPDSSNRYFINGTVYNGWDNVPNEYKTAPLPGASSQTGSGFGPKLRF